MTSPEFEKFFREEFNSLSNLAYTVVKDTDEARDVVQQVFLNYWQRRESIEIRGSAKGYFYKAVLNASINRLKKARTLIPIENLQQDKFFEEPAEEDTRMRDHLHRTINDLPPVCQQVFRLSRFTNMTNKEIAEEMDISVKAVEKHITKAMKVLREKMKPLMANNYLMMWLLGLLYYFLMNQVGYLLFILSI
ncbi:MAG: RNA polymerase sigma-70 factor [Bacteroidales bacterium]